MTILLGYHLVQLLQFIVALLKVAEACMNGSPIIIESLRHTQRRHVELDVAILGGRLMLTSNIVVNAHHAGFDCLHFIDHLYWRVLLRVREVVC